MNHKSHSYVPSTPSTSQSKQRLTDHRNSTPAIHLKMEDQSLEDSRPSLDSQTSLTRRSRHPTWSHSQHQEHKRKLSQFRLRTASVSRSTQTDSDNGFAEDVLENQTNRINEENVDTAQVESKPNKEDTEQVSFDRGTEDSQSSAKSNMKIFEEDDDGLNIYGDFTTSL